MIGIICAMDCEVNEIKAFMQNGVEKAMFGIPIYEGTIAKEDIVIVKSGIGKVNAAMSTALLLSQYTFEMIINVGIAGGLLTTQKVLDVVICDQVIQYDYDTSPIDGEEGIGLAYPCDQALKSSFMASLKSSNIRTWKGDIASGDRFVTATNYFDEIRRVFPTCVCCEMEAGAIAQVCNKMNVPCLIIRSLSDVAANKKSEMSYSTFCDKSAKIAGKATFSFIQTIAQMYKKE